MNIHLPWLIGLTSGSGSGASHGGAGTGGSGGGALRNPLLSGPRWGAEDASSSDDQERLTGLLWEERQVVPW